MKITYPQVLRQNFFYFGTLPLPLARTLIGRTVDFERSHYIERGIFISPTERAMLSDLEMVGLGTSSDPAEFIHPHYTVAYRDWVDRLEKLQRHRPEHPFFSRRQAAVSEYLLFLNAMTQAVQDLIPSYALARNGVHELLPNESMARDVNPDKF